MVKKGHKKESEATFPERLRQLRTSKKLSQESLGKLAGLHYTHIGRYERGLSKPSAENLQAIADSLSVSSDYLLNGSTENFARASFKDKDLLKMFTELEKLQEEDKHIVKKLIEAFLFQNRVKADLAS